ncbi:MAG: TolC family protein, partial [Acidobacteriota bacterium]
MYSTGRTSYSNLIRVHIELDKLKDRYKSLKDKLPSIKVALNTIMNRPIENKIFVEKKIEDKRFHIKRSSLFRILKSANPELKTLDHFTFSREARVKLARKNFLPDISIGADVIVTGDSSVPGLVDSGKDPFLLKMSMNIPLRFKKINASIREAKIKLDAVKYKRIEKENSLILALESTLFEFEDSGRIIDLYRNSLIPKAQQAFEVTKTAFSTGKAGFLDFIDTQRTLLDFELTKEKAKSSHLQNLALIEKIIGKNLKYLKRQHIIREKK